MLNKYSKEHPIELSNVKIENYQIDGAEINGGEVKQTDWNEVSAKKSKLSNIIFRKDVNENVNFNDSTLTDILFEDVTLRDVRFVKTTLKNVRFIHCTLNGINIDQTKDSHIKVSRSRVINSSFSDGQLKAGLTNSILTKKTSLTDLHPPSSLTFEKSELDDVDFSLSVLDSFKLDTVTSNKSGFDIGTIKKVDITGGDISFGFTEARIDEITVHDIGKVGLAFQDGFIKSMHINRCVETYNINLFSATVGNINVEHCTLINFAPIRAKIDHLEINNAKLMNSNFHNMNTKSIDFKNVVLGGELNFKDAKTGKLKETNVTKQPGLKLKTDGSNINF